MNPFLLNFPLFADFSDRERELLETIMVVADYPEGHVVIRKGERVDPVRSAMFVVVQGAVRVTVERPEGGFGVDRTLGPGDVFGTIALVSDTERTATCTTTTKTTLARLDRPSFRELNTRSIGVYARFQHLVARSLARDLRALSGQLAKEFSAP